MEFIGLAGLLELFLVLVDLLGRRGLVVVAEEAQERATEVLREVDRGDRALLVELVRRSDDAAAPALDRGIPAGRAAGGEEGVAATGAGARDADLAIAIRLR